MYSSPYGPLDGQAQHVSPSEAADTLLLQLAQRKDALDAQLATVAKAREARIASVSLVDRTRQMLLWQDPSGAARRGGSPALAHETTPPQALEQRIRGEPVHPTVPQRVALSVTAPHVLSRDPVTRANELIASSASAAEEARHVESLRDALRIKVDEESSDALKLRTQLDRTSGELRSTHAALISKQREVEVLRQQLDKMVTLTSHMLQSVDPATAGTLSVAVAQLQYSQSGRESAGAGIPSSAPRSSSVTPTIARLTGEVSIEVKSLASRSVVTDAHGRDSHADEFQHLLGQFDSWAHNHDSVVAMLRALPGKPA